MTRLHINSTLLSLVTAVSLALPGAAWTDEQTLTLADQDSVGITIYNSNLALVRDVRKVNLTRGVNVLAFESVSAQIKPETASLTGGDFTLIEQNFDFDLLSPAKLIEKAVGGKVRVYRENPVTGDDRVEEATVLSAYQGTVLEFDDRIEFIGRDGLPGRLVFTDLPENLRARPTLSIRLNSTSRGTQNLELGYLTGGIGWQADYVATLNRKSDELALQGWVTLTNTSGSPYRDATVQLVAGDVNIVRQRMAPRARAANFAMAQEAVAVASEEQLLEYHLYTLPNRTTIAQNQTKQVALLSAPKVEAERVLSFRGQPHLFTGTFGEFDRESATVNLEFTNSEAAGLGLPLPKGTVRVYQPDSKNQLQFVGEDTIDHTAKDLEVELLLGRAFDVTLTRTQTAFEHKRARVFERPTTEYTTSWKLTFKNAKAERATVKLIEPFTGKWEIIKDSQTHTRLNAREASWTVSVPAEGSTELNYTVRVTI